MKAFITAYQKNCAFCGKPTGTKHHLVFGRGRRPLADEDGLVLPSCDRCHNMGPISERIHDNAMAEKLSKMLGQLAYEKAQVATGLSEEDAREKFRRRYGESYL